MSLKVQRAYLSGETKIDDASAFELLTCVCIQILPKRLRRVGLRAARLIMTELVEQREGIDANFVARALEAMTASGRSCDTCRQAPSNGMRVSSIFAQQRIHGSVRPLQRSKVLHEKRGAEKFTPIVFDRAGSRLPQPPRSPPCMMAWLNHQTHNSLRQSCAV